jgi:hypothetical protein
MVRLARFQLLKISQIIHFLFYLAGIIIAIEWGSVPTYGAQF